MDWTPSLAVRNGAEVETVRFLESSIRGFGKFVERPFRYAAGAQLFVGSNEAGKSTLQRFLLAMLFGLKREDRKRRDYLPEYDLYKPWSGAGYAGSLLYELADGRRFEVRRVFERQDEEVRLFDAISGRELTSEFPLDHRKERPFMQNQLQLSRQLFEATTSMGQQAGRLSEDGAGALRERIQGLLDSGDENLSARAALTRLEQLRERLGSERTPTRGLGALLRQRRDLQLELEEARARHAEVLELHARRDTVATEYGRYERAWEERRRTELVHERRQLAQRLSRLEDLEEEIERLGARLVSYGDVVEVDVSDHPKAREMAAAHSALVQEIQTRRTDLEVAEASLREWRHFETRLSRALGGLDSAGARLLEQRAERLREFIGRVREARNQEEAERRRNRAIVEALQSHHNRDWTDDAFMGQLAATRALLASDDSVERLGELQSSRRAYGRRRLHALGQTSVLVLALGALAAGSWDFINALAWGPWLPLAGALALLFAFFAWSIRGVMAARDRARALDLQMEAVTQRVRQAREWLETVLRSNGMQVPEEIESARREYESLRAQAERISAAGNRERLALESELIELAGALHDQVQRCDLEALSGMRLEPSAGAYGMPPFQEPEPPASTESSDPLELQRLDEDLRRLPALRHACAWAERFALECEARRSRLEQEKLAVEQRQSKAAQVQADLATLLRRNGARDLDDFTLRAGRQGERQELLMLLRPLQREREGILGGETPETMRARLHLLEKTPTQADLFDARRAEDRGDDPADLAVYSLDELGRREDDLAAERERLSERLAARENEGRLPAEIELQAQELEQRIDEERQRLAALQLAMETLEQVSATRHREAAPRMNERVGQIFSRLSLGAHREVRLDEDLTPRVRNDGEGYFGAESLSGGAADQLYFALRVTAGEQLGRTGEFLPLILDDPFVQYDLERLQAALDLVAELSREHQVLFFTCEPGQARSLGERLRTRGVKYGIELL